MEAMRLRGLRRSFILYVFNTLAVAAILSVLAVWGCITVQKIILPDSDIVNLTIRRSDSNGNEISTMIPLSLNDKLKEIPIGISTEDSEGNPFPDTKNVKYSITSVENSFSALTPKRQLVYRISQIGMIALPVLCSLTGILVCGLLFYRKKLKKPILLLSSATKRIAEQSLDFQISYQSKDEMGALCDSFERMRMTLKENNQKMWEMLEERKRLQGSVAHDLRNPIAIIKGYAQYLQLGLSGDKINIEKISSIASSILHTSLRMERYTDSLRKISKIEELEIQAQQVDFTSLSSDIQKDLSLLTEEKNLKLDWESTVSEKELNLDVKVLYRILENLIGNAARFADSEISVSCRCRDGFLDVTVSDDGPGFPQRGLNSNDSYVYTESKDENHLGMGLAVCRILCRKHGGQLTLSNSKCGAVAQFTLAA